MTSEKIAGREFSTTVKQTDLDQIAEQMQTRQTDNVRKLEALASGDKHVIDLYRAKIMNSDFATATHPYLSISDDRKAQITENLQEKAIAQYKAKQLAYLQEEALKENWTNEMREIMERKLADLPRT